MTDTSTHSRATSLRRRFLSGASWALSGKIVSAGATLLGNALLARLLSPSDMGTYFLAFSVVSIFAIFGQWGMERGLVKLVAAELAGGRPELARSGIMAAFVVVFIVSVLIALLLLSPAGEWVLAAGFGSTLLVSLSMLMGLWIFIRAMQGLVSESFRGFHDIRLATVFGGLVTAVVSLLLYLVVWVYQGRANLDQVMQMTVLAAGLSLLAGMFILSRKVRGLQPGGGVYPLKILRFGLPLLITSVSLFGVREFHLWILAVFQPESEVALYGSALRLVMLLEMSLMIVNAVIPPMVADLYSQRNFVRLQGVLQKTATLMSIPAIVVFGLILLFGADALGIVYGEPYREAFVPFVILAVGQLVNVLTGSPGILLTMSGHERVVMRSALGGGVIGIVVSFFGVQEWGAAGAAAGYSVGLVLVNVAMWAYSYRRLSIRTHGSPIVMMNMLRKVRARIEADGTNGGMFFKLDKIVRKIEEIKWGLLGYQIIECFGDSHAAVFRGLNHTAWAGNRRFRTVAVRGATAYGIGNPNSKTNALQVFQDRLKKVPQSRIVIFMMGEVDVGFLSWLRAKKNGMNPMACMEEAWRRYTNFLTDVKQTHPRLVLCSVPLPTIGDDELHGDVANARREISATQLERTAMTLEFNRRLKEWAAESGVDYMDFDPYALDKETMLVKRELLNKNAADHHYETEAFHLLIGNVINKLH